mgnify:CR=1 FL=1
MTNHWSCLSFVIKIRDQHSVFGTQKTYEQVISEQVGVGMVKYEFFGQFYGCNDIHLVVGQVLFYIKYLNTIIKLDYKWMSDIS